MPVDDMVELRDTVFARVKEKFTNADITVTANPAALDNETVFQKVSQIAQRPNLAIHHLTVQHIWAPSSRSVSIWKSTA